MCGYFLGADSKGESESTMESRQSSAGLAWVVVPLLSFGVTVTVVAMVFCWCCCWQRRRCDVIAWRAGSAGVRRDLLQSLVGPPMRKRILFMRDNILYANGTGTTAAKVCAQLLVNVPQTESCSSVS